MSDTADPVVSTRAGDGVLILTLNRPEARNALSTALLAGLAELLAQAEDDSEIRAVVLTGGPKVFAAGADVKEMAAHDAVSILSDTRPRHWKAIREFSKPLIGAVNGFCLGGGNELAMCCDILIAGEDAQFGQPEINLGIIPGAGGTQRLTRTIGRSRAMEMVLAGSFLSAREALAFGLVSRVVPPELTITKALELARVIAAKPPLAVKAAKQAVRASEELPLAEGLKAERALFCQLFATADRREGLAAFAEKRTPKFEGK